MKKIAMLSSAAALATMTPAFVTPFDNDAGSSAPAKAKRAKPAAPLIGEIVGNIPVPAVTRAAPGSKSPFPFDTLEVGQSFPVANKTVKQMSSIVSNQNRKATNYRDVLDGEGKPVMETVPMKDANGNLIPGATTTVPKREQIKVFVVAEYKANPKAKPETRVWRKQ